jgi:5'-deoxynucleotidase YfbR-like HD superfamily hydrolase
MPAKAQRAWLVDRGFGDPDLVDSTASEETADDSPTLPSLTVTPFEALGTYEKRHEEFVQDDKPRLAVEDVRSDVAAILWSMRLHGLRRYYKQRHWEQETSEAEYAARIEAGPRLESVSEHSWHIADIILLLAPYFQAVSRERCLEMAILHDKLELLTGDLSPIGRDGTGLNAHAFNVDARSRKEEREFDALEAYLKRLRPSLRNHQRAVFIDMQKLECSEARLLKAVDKMQTLAFVHWKKKGVITDLHLQFTIRYASRCLAYFPPIQQHYSEMLRALLRQVARKRSVPLTKLYNEFVYDVQTSLPF